MIDADGSRRPPQIGRRAALRALGSIAAGALGGPLGGCGGGPVHLPGLTGDRPPRRIWRPQRANGATALLVHGLGTRSALWDLPGSGGLAPTLAAAGYTVIAPELDPAGDWSATLTPIAAAVRGPLFGIGLDLGGTALYRCPARFTGRIGVGAPIASGGFSAAVRGVLTADGAPTWRSFERHRVGGRRVIRLLLTHGLPAKVHRPLIRAGLAPMPAAQRRAWHTPGAGSAVPRLLPDLPPPGPAWGPTLVVTAPTDGLAPPWQCDPHGFGADWPELRVRTASRVNGDGREFNHLDLAVHPDARRRIWPMMIDWMNGTLEARRGG